MTSRSLAVAATLALTLVPGALGDEPAPVATEAQPAGAVAPVSATPPVADADRWLITVTPRVWFVALDGDLRLPGVSGKSTLDSLQLDHTVLEPMGQLDIQADRWLFTFTGCTVSNSGHAPDGGETELDLSSFTFLAGYKLWQHNLDGSPTEAPRSALRLWLLGGLRYSDLEASRVVPARQSPEPSSGDEAWVDLLAGARLEIQLAEQFYTSFEISAGGLSESFSADVAAAFTWRPVRWFGAQVGYRYLFIDLDQGEGSDRFGLNGSAAGMFAGASLRF